LFINLSPPGAKVLPIASPPQQAVRTNTDPEDCLAMKQRLFRPALLVACSIALLAKMGFAHAEKFTIAAISDTQNYTDVTKPQPRGINTFIQQMQYLAETRTDKIWCL
jgi:hypothetical protein